MSFVQSIEKFARERPQAPALFFPDFQPQPLTYGELARIVTQVSSRLAAAEVVKGDCVALEMANDYRHALLLIACARNGIATVSSTPDALAGLISLTAVLTDKPRRSGSSGAVRIVPVDESWEVPADDALPAGPALSPSADDLCRIMMTSGSTGRPKGVALTYAMIEERIKSYAWAFGAEFPTHDRILCGMKLPTSLGFGFLFYMLARGGLFCSDSVDFDRIIGALKANEINALVTTPYTLTELLEYSDKSRKSLPRLPLIMTAGSLVSSELAKRVRQRLCERLVIFYGTTETGVVTSTCEGETLGQVVPGRRISIIEDGTPLPLGQVGTIRIEADAGVLPFFDAVDWQSRRPKTFFEPGDAGMLTKANELVVLGRKDGVINVGGSKTTPEVIEQSLSGAPGIKECGVVCRNDAYGIGRITALLVLAPGFSEQRFLSYCEAHVLRDFLPGKFVVVKTIPRTANSKIDRVALDRLAG